MEIEGFPGYFIYQDGRVFSKKSNFFMKLNFDRYYRVNLYNKGISTRSVHRLVAQHYIRKFTEYGNV